MVSLNVDLGELPDEPEELYALATMVNVACGGHAGDAASMRAALLLAQAAGTAVAAHPSYPDREGFGRRTRFSSGPALDGALAEQMAGLAELARIAGVTVVATKPHGALYHDAANDPAIAKSVITATVRAFGPIAIVGPPAGALGDAARAEGLASIREGFADRAYQSDGSLVPRSRAGAMLTDPSAAAEQAVRLAGSGQLDTICVHGDSPGAVEIARAVRSALAAAGHLDRRTRE